MKLIIPKHILEYEGKVQSLLIKATDLVAKDQISEFKWIEEYQSGLIKYVEEVFKMVAMGLSLKLNVNPEEVMQKSVRIDMPTLIKAANGEEVDYPLFYKSLFTRLKDKLSTAFGFFKKFGFNKGKPLEPVKFKGHVRYNPETGRPLTNEEWNNLSNDIVDFLGDKIGSLEEELVVRAGLFGKLQQSMERDGISLDEQKNMEWDEVEDRYGKIPSDQDEAIHQYNLTSPEVQAIEYSKNHAAEYLSIKDGSLKNKIVNMVRAQITEGLREGLSSQEMIQRLFWIDPRDELGAQFKGDTLDAINRDWRRVCFPAKTKITTLIGKQDIEKLKVGRSVITHTGKIKKITEIMKRKYSGRMIIIRTKSGQELEATEDHPIYVFRNNKYLWIPIKDLKIGDKLLKVEQTGAFAGRKHKKKYKEYMSKVAKEKEFNKHIPNIKINNNRKSDITLKERYNNGEIESWNKGETAKSNKIVARITRKINQGWKEGRQVWNKGLTKETDERILKYANKGKGRVVKPETTEKWRESFCSNPNNKDKLFSKGKKGYVKNIFTGKKELYRSTYEKLFMEYCNNNKIQWTTKHRIFIKYKDDNGKSHGYIPDFLVTKNNKKYLIEVKAMWQINHNFKNTLNKLHAGKIYCIENKMKFKVLTKSWLKEKGLVA